MPLQNIALSFIIKHARIVIKPETCQCLLIEVFIIEKRMRPFSLYVILLIVGNNLLTRLSKVTIFSLCICW